MGCPAGGIPGAEGDARMKNPVKYSAVRFHTLGGHSRKELMFAHPAWISRILEAISGCNYPSLFPVEDMQWPRSDLHTFLLVEEEQSLIFIRVVGMRVFYESLHGAVLCLHQAVFAIAKYTWAWCAPNVVAMKCKGLINLSTDPAKPKLGRPFVEQGELTDGWADHLLGGRERGACVVSQLAQHYAQALMQFLMPARCVMQDDTIPETESEEGGDDAPPMFNLLFRGAAVPAIHTPGSNASKGGAPTGNAADMDEEEEEEGEDGAQEQDDPPPFLLYQSNAAALPMLSPPAPGMAQQQQQQRHLTAAGLNPDGTADEGEDEAEAEGLDSQAPPRFELFPTPCPPSYAPHPFGQPPDHRHQLTSQTGESEAAEDKVGGGEGDSQMPPQFELAPAAHGPPPPSPPSHPPRQGWRACPETQVQDEVEEEEEEEEELPESQQMPPQFELIPVAWQRLPTPRALLLTPQQQHQHQQHQQEQQHSGQQQQHQQHQQQWQQQEEQQDFEQQQQQQQQQQWVQQHEGGGSLTCATITAPTHCRHGQSSITPQHGLLVHSLDSMHQASLVTASEAGEAR
eukprot:1142058-Pelagomonas_calceolata.AAC.6